MFKRIFNDFYVRISAKTVNISEDDFMKMTKEIRSVINKYGATISVFTIPEEMIEYINREKKANRKLRRINSFLQHIKDGFSVRKVEEDRK